MRTAILLLAVTVALIAPARAGADEEGPVPELLTQTGTVMSKDGGPLPRDALLTVDLEDVSRADAAAETLAETQIVIHGEPASIPFTLAYSGSAVKPGAVYAVRAQISSQGRLLFTTTERHQVDPLNPTPLQLGLTRVATATEGEGIANVPLTDTYWKLLEVDGQPIQVAEQMREPNLVLHSEQSRLAGSGGVNRLIGGYTVDGDALTSTELRRR